LSDQDRTSPYGRVIRRLLKERKWSQMELARRSGLGLQAVNAIITGRSPRPQTSSMDAIAEAFGVPRAELYAEAPEGVTNGAA
jgi:transcriptional regulator with XRE-family HTH domain